MVGYTSYLLSENCHNREAKKFRKDMGAKNSLFTEN